MKKLKNFWLNIPRPYRAALNLLAILLILSLFYVSIGAPVPHPNLAFRRAERANLVGPSTILFSDSVENYYYDHLIMAETELGVITWVNDDQWGFNYLEKTGDITVFSAPKEPFDWGYSHWATELPVFLVDDYPEAVRAELELDIQGYYAHNLNGELLHEPLDHHFFLSSDREDDGFFYFSLTLDYLDPVDENGNETNAEHGSNGYALDMLARNSTNFWNVVNPRSSADITAAVRLYDASDTLMVERDLILRTAS